METLAESEATLVRSGHPRTTLERLFLEEVARPDPDEPKPDSPASAPATGSDGDDDGNEAEEESEPKDDAP